MKSLELILLVLTLTLVTSSVYAISSASDQDALQESFEALQKDLDDISRSALDLLKQKEAEFQNKLESYIDAQFYNSFLF